MSYEYKLEHGHYVLYDGEAPLMPGLVEVAIAFDQESGTLHKHGCPAYVQDWHRQAQEKLRQAGFPSMADDLVVITGRFAVEDINRCLSITGYVGRLYARLQAELAAPQP